MTNNGTISGTGSGGSTGVGIDSDTATVTNNGTISGTGGAAGHGVGIQATTATVTNNGTISGTGTASGARRRHQRHHRDRDQ